MLFSVCLSQRVEVQLRCEVKEKGKGMDQVKAELLQRTFGIYLEDGVRGQSCNRKILGLLIM